MTSQKISIKDEYKLLITFGISLIVATAFAFVLSNFLYHGPLPAELTLAVPTLNNDAIEFIIIMLGASVSFVTYEILTLLFNISYENDEFVGVIISLFAIFFVAIGMLLGMLC